MITEYRGHIALASVALIAFEVIELHQFFQGWFNGTLPKGDVTFEGAASVCSLSFTLIDPHNKFHSSADLLKATFAAQRLLRLRLVSCVGFIFMSRSLRLRHQLFVECLISFGLRAKKVHKSIISFLLIKPLFNKAFGEKLMLTISTPNAVG